MRHLNVQFAVSASSGTYWNISIYGRCFHARFAIYSTNSNAFYAYQISGLLEELSKKKIFVSAIFESKIGFN